MRLTLEVSCTSAPNRKPLSGRIREHAYRVLLYILIVGSVVLPARRGFAREMPREMREQCERARRTHQQCEESWRRQLVRCERARIDPDRCVRMWRERRERNSRRPRAAPRPGALVGPQLRFAPSLHRPGALSLKNIRPAPAAPRPGALVGPQLRFAPSLHRPGSLSLRNLGRASPPRNPGSVSGTVGRTFGTGLRLAPTHAPVVKQGALDLRASSGDGISAFPGADAEAPGDDKLWASPASARITGIRRCDDSLPPISVQTGGVRFAGRPLVPLGGDYWKVGHRTYPDIGAQGSCWIRTPAGRALQSPPFRPLTRYVGLRARGRGRIVLRAKGGANIASRPISSRWMELVALDLGAPPSAGQQQLRLPAVQLELVPERGQFLDVDDVRQYSTALLGRVKRLAGPFHKRAFGFADLHVHVAVHQSMGGLQGVRTMWGVPGGNYADYQRNPSLIFRDIPRCDGYNHRGVVPLAEKFRGFMAAGMIGAINGRTPKEATVHEVLQMFLHEKGEAGVKRETPFKDGFHQQHHITAIRRAYEGGLRLMSALVVHSEFMELIMGRVERLRDGRPYVQLTREIDLARAGVCYMRELARLNSEWMEIAYTPEDAQRIISSNRLAIVLGIELPDAGNLLGPGATPEREVAELYELGIRQVIIIHGADNKNGGAAIFQDVYDWFNDLLWTGRDAQNRVVRNYHDVKRTKGRFIVPREGGCGVPGAYQNRRGECVLYTLDGMDMRPVVTPLNAIGWDYFPLVLAGAALFPVAGAAASGVHPLVGAAMGLVMPLVAPFIPILPIVYAVLMSSGAMTTPMGMVAPPAGMLANLIAGKSKYRSGVYGNGHLNSKGLTERGKAYVRALMNRGMVVDVSHASDLSVLDVFKVSRQFAVERHGNRCAVGDLTADRAKQLAQRGSADCFGASYPLIASHHQFRAQGFQRLVTELDQHRGGWATTTKGYAPREFEMPDHQLAWFRRIGGVVGVFMGQEVVDPPSWQRRIGVRNDCGNSSKSFAWGFAYANQMLGGKGVALSSDAGFHEMVGPRFGSDACNGYRAGNEHERMLNADLYDIQAQRDGVRYQGLRQRYPTRNHEPLQPYRQGKIVYDYNVDGWANYGVVPDLLQDARNVGMTAADMAPIFRSAQDYVDAWAKAYSVSNCRSRKDGCRNWKGPKHQKCREVCKGTCPGDNLRLGAPPPAPHYEVRGVFTNNPVQDAIDGVCAARQLQARSQFAPRELCQKAFHRCGLDRSCHHRSNVCAGVMGAGIWQRCEDDPDRPLTGDAMHGPEIRLGACYAAKGLACTDVNMPDDRAATARGRKTCNEVARALGAACSNRGVVSRARWERFDDKGCRGRKRLFSSRLTNVGAMDAEVACRLTKARIGGRPPRAPTHCLGSLVGMWGEFEVDDQRCNRSFRPPRWSRFERKGCRGPKRVYSAKILDTTTMRWEDACATTPATVASKRFPGPTRCIGSPFGMWGEFDVPDRQCAFSYRAPYWDVTDDLGCSGGKRRYSAKILNTGRLKWEAGCRQTANTIAGRAHPRPTRCSTFVTGTWGEWDVDDSRCTGGKNPPYWERFEDKGCRGPKRMYSAKLLNTGDLRWEDACKQAAAIVSGVRFATPTRCAREVTGVWGEFEVPDANCQLNFRRPHWEPFADKGCRGPKRMFSAKLLNTGSMRWEDACNQMPARVRGYRFSRPTRCVNGGTGIWGEFEIPDRQCDAKFRASRPYWGTPKNMGCLGAKRYYEAQILNTGSMRWEDACRETPIRLGQHTVRTYRCRWHVWGMMGDFLVPDPNCR